MFFLCQRSFAMLQSKKTFSKSSYQTPIEATILYKSIILPRLSEVIVLRLQGCAFPNRTPVVFTVYQYVGGL